MLVALDRVVTLGGQDEICGDQLRPLMQQLIERVLSVGGGLAKQDGPGRIVDILAGTRDGFTVRLHGQLLKVGGEAMQVLVESGKGEYALFSSLHCPSGTTRSEAPTVTLDASAHRKSPSTTRSAGRR